MQCSINHFFGIHIFFCNFNILSGAGESFIIIDSRLSKTHFHPQFYIKISLPNQISTFLNTWSFLEIYDILMYTFDLNATPTSKNWSGPSTTSAALCKFQFFSKCVTNLILLLLKKADVVLCILVMIFLRFQVKTISVLFLSGVVFENKFHGFLSQFS